MEFIVSSSTSYLLTLYCVFVTLLLCNKNVLQFTFHVFVSQYLRMADGRENFEVFVIIFIIGNANGKVVVF